MVENCPTNFYVISVYAHTLIRKGGKVDTKFLLRDWVKNVDVILTCIFNVASEIKKS